VPAVARALADAGIATLPDESLSTPLVAVTAPASVVRVTAWQAHIFDVEIAAHAGVTGGQLDGALPLPPGAPPISYLIAAWVTTGTSAGAQWSRQLLGDQDWAHAPQVMFPGAVLTMFVADVAEHLAPGTATAGTATAPAGTTTASATADSAGAATVAAGAAGLRDAARSQARSQAVMPCSTVAGFVDSVLNQVFGALHLDPATVAGYVSGALGGGALATLAATAVGWLTGLWNHAVDLAKAAVQGVIEQLTRPVVDAIRLAVGAIATITTVTSYLKRWTATVALSSDPDRFAVGDEPDRTGTLTVHVDSSGESADWPAVLVDCAQTVGLTLPVLTRENMPVTWRVLSESEPGLATFDRGGPPYAGVLDHDLSSQLGYTTGREDAETASGDLVTSSITLGVAVRRTEVDKLRELITAFVTGQVPTIVAPVVGPIVNPIITSYLALIFKHLDDITAIDGTTQLHITHHTPPATTTLPPCATGGAGIPAGTYTGDLSGSFTVVEKGVSGETDETYAGHIVLTSDGSAVTGTFAMHWSGAGDITVGRVTSHVTEDSTITAGTLSGPATDPAVDATIVGQVVIDGTPAAIPTSHPAHLHLHISASDCRTVTGDAIAMLREILPDPPDTITGDGTWTASA
jgi:hypothetical protein